MTTRESVALEIQFDLMVELLLRVKLEGLECVLQRGPWMIRNSPILVSKWSSKLSLKKGEVNKVPVWVKLFNVPVLAYSGDESALKHEVVMAIENEKDDKYTRENSFANLKEEESELDKGLNVSSPVNANGKDNEKKVDSMVVNEEANSQNQGSLWEKFKASKEASSSKSKFTSLDDDDSDDDEEVYMPDGIYGGGFMDSLEDDLDCYECYRTQVYDLTPQEQAFCDQYDIRLNSHGRN
ncbi:ATPase, F1/V1/A1 complex, alpha/beta subunit [Tanacetum coccineum]